MKWTPEEVKGKTPEQLVAMQMEDWLFDDDALMASYDPRKVGACLEWVADKVRMNAEHAGVAVCCHEEVFRLARDYFVDGHAKEASVPPSPAAKRKRKEVRHEVPASSAPHPADPTAQTSLFGEGK